MDMDNYTLVDDSMLRVEILKGSMALSNGAHCCIAIVAGYVSLFTSLLFLTGILSTTVAAPIMYVSCMVWISPVISSDCIIENVLEVVPITNLPYNLL